MSDIEEKVATALRRERGARMLAESEYEEAVALVRGMHSEGVYLVTEEALVATVDDYGPQSQWVSTKEWAYTVLEAIHGKS